MAGIGVGVIVFGIILPIFVESVGLGWTLRIHALINLIGIPCGAVYNVSLGFNKDENLVPKKSKNTYGSTPVLINGNKTKTCCLSCTFELLPPDLRRSPLIYMMTFVGFTFFFAYSIPYVYIPKRAQQLGLSNDSASFLLSIAGIATTLNRLVLGWIGKT